MEGAKKRWPRYRRELQILRRYFRSYGGRDALVGSPYLHVSLVVALALFGIWGQRSWWEIPIGVLPNILGFSIGGFAMFLTFGDERFRNASAGTKKVGKPSPLMIFSSTFLHFIFVQVAALLLALVARSEPLSWFDFGALEPVVGTFKYVGWYVGFGMFCYAILSTVAACAALFRLVAIFDISRTPPALRDSEDLPVE